MTEWRETTTAALLEHGAIEIGDGYRAKNAEFTENGGLPFVRVADVGAAIRLDGPDELPLDRSDRYGSKVSRPFDSLITMKGTVGRVALVPVSARPFVYSPQISYLRSHDPGAVDPRWLRYWLESPEFRAQALATKGATDMADYINLRDQRRMRITLPPTPVQRQIADVLSALDELIENDRRRVELLEQTAQAVYQEWFARFRLPGHEDATFVDSSLGPIPGGWEVKSVESLAARERSAVTSGPFGSKLGRKDYVDAGVPIIRGANLRVGGGFDESSFVFVTAEKALELRSSTARRRDVLVTQRGTLGQVGLIPARSRFDSYVLSQSQMKVTVDASQMTPEFLYAQLRTEDTTARFIAQAMTSGVPHVNLALLREFEILAPPIEHQRRFMDAVSPLSNEEWALGEQRARLVELRDLLLPKLVTGQIDVSELDLDAVVERVA